IYVAGVCTKKGSGAGIFLGNKSPRNLALSVPGPTTSSSGSPRAHLYAIYQVLLAFPPDKTLIVHCMSKQIVRDLCYHTTEKMALRWPGNNGDLYPAVVDLLSSRQAKTTFVHV
ncbi:hypothetical protein C8F01DRAFT_932828, partial [Mycena amicta]